MKNLILIGLHVVAFALGILVAEMLLNAGWI